MQALMHRRRHHRDGGAQPPAGSITARSVIFDIADNWGDDTYVGIRSIEFRHASSALRITVDDYAAYASSELNAGYDAAQAFDPSTEKTGSWSQDNWLTNSDTGNQRLIIVFDTPQAFDRIVVNNSHSYGGSTDTGARHVKITASADEITDTTYNAAVSNATALGTRQWAQHTGGDIEDPQEVWAAANPAGSTPTNIVASGGTLTPDGDYKVHTFLNDGAFEITSGGGEVEYLIVAGGGGNSDYIGNSSCGGAGGGGLLTGLINLASGTYPIVIGDGGISGPAPANGEDSTALGLTAVGGGAFDHPSPVAGGSGAGGRGLNGSTGAAGTPGQGTGGATGSGSAPGSASRFRGGGGGGAWLMGTTARGGKGLPSSISGTETYYGGGGGGGSAKDRGTASQSPGGLGGGGAGSNESINATGGVDGTGGGAGGGAGHASIQEDGGSGIVIIRYRTGG